MAAGTLNAWEALPRTAEAWASFPTSATRSAICRWVTADPTRRTVPAASMPSVGVGSRPMMDTTSRKLSVEMPAALGGRKHGVEDGVEQRGVHHVRPLAPGALHVLEQVLAAVGVFDQDEAEVVALERVAVRRAGDDKLGPRAGRVFRVPARGGPQHDGVLDAESGHFDPKVQKLIELSSHMKRWPLLFHEPLSTWVRGCIVLVSTQGAGVTWRPYGA